MDEIANGCSRQFEQHRAFFNRARALEQQRAQAEAIVVMAQYAEIRPAQQLHRGAAQAFVQCLPMTASLRPLPQQRPQRLAWPLTGQDLQARGGQCIQLQAFEGVGQALHQRARRFLQQHGLVMLQVHQQQGLVGVAEQCLPLPQGQPLAQQAGDGVRAIGQAEMALELLSRRSMRREAFGQPLAKLGANYDIIAECRMEIEMARLLCLKAAWMIDQGNGKAAAPWISQIKVIAPRVALKVVDEAVQMHGAQGISQDTPLARSWTHLRTLRLADGPDAVHRRQVAREELKKYTQEKF